MKNILILIGLIAGSAFNLHGTADTNDKKKPDSITAAVAMLPQLTEMDRVALLEEFTKAWAENESIIPPVVYQVYDQLGGLIFEETVPFEKSPSPQLKKLISTSEFLFDHENTKVYIR